MPKFSLKIPTFHRLTGLFHIPAPLLLGASFAIFSCNEPKIEQETRIEPWKKDSEQLPAAQAAKKHEFRVASGQLLQFELPGRKARPQGAISGMKGSILVDLNALQFVTGQLQFDLRELRITPESTRTPATKKNSASHAEKSAPESYDGTKLAHQWLGLGKQVPHHEDNLTATFVIDSARDLSHPNAYSGAIRKSESGAGGEVRQVYLTAVGQLKMRGLSVDRHISLTVQFHFAESAARGSVPEKINVALRGATHLPLAEYEIAPRDEAGHLITEQLALLGPVIGSVAKLSGNIELIAQKAGEL